MNLILITDFELMALHRYTRLAALYLNDEYHFNKYKPKREYDRIKEITELKSVRILCEKIENIEGFTEIFNEYYNRH